MSNTPEKGIVKKNENDSEKDHIYQVKVGNATLDIRQLTDDEVKQREWEKFDSLYPRKITVILRNLKHHNKCMLTVATKLGVYHHKGKWDVYIPDSNKTISNFIKDKEKDEDLNPIRYFIGVDDSISDAKFEEVKKILLKHKLLS